MSDKPGSGTAGEHKIPDHITLNVSVPTQPITITVVTPEPKKTRPRRLLEWLIARRKDVSSATLIGFCVFAFIAVAGIYIFVMPNWTDLDPEPISFFIDGTPLTYPGDQIPLNAVDAIAAESELRVTRRADERLLQMVYFTIGAVLTAAGIIGAFGWFSSTRLREIEEKTLEAKLRKMENDAELAKAELHAHVGRYDALQRAEDRIPAIKRAIRYDNPQAALAEANVCAACLTKTASKESGAVKSELIVQLDRLWLDLGTMIRDDDIVAADLIYQDLDELHDSLLILFQEQGDSGMSKHVRLARQFLDQMPEPAGNGAPTGVEGANSKPLNAASTASSTSIDENESFETTPQEI